MIFFRKKSLFLLVVLIVMVCLSSCKKKDAAVKCFSPQQVTNQISPDVLYASSIQCLDENRAEDAFFLVGMAQAYEGFDAWRLTDRNRTIHIRAYKDRTSKQERLYMKTYNQIKNDYDGGFSVLRSMCERAKRIGMPNYYPHYMMIPLIPKKNEILIAPLEEVRVLSDAEMRLLYDTSYQHMWEGGAWKGGWSESPLLPFCRDIESKVKNLKTMKLMR